VSLELARTPAAADEIVQSWRARGLIGAARRNIWVDFLFLTIYSTSLALLVTLSARAAVATALVERRRGEAAGAVGALAMWTAGALDAVENVALLRMLGGRIDRLSVRVSFASAAAKFILVGAGIVGSFAALAASAVRARR
jgi:hypothetical protein